MAWVSSEHYLVCNKDLCRVNLYFAGAILVVSQANCVSLYEYKTNTESDNIYFMWEFQCKILFST